mmetsp:Transcript_8499/g.16884  ORF Transcript_8499/g.16884 Transcript_8499/m.16884 type:complete len:95 (+) Transcript_8499:1615-1899(+)
MLSEQLPQVPSEKQHISRTASRGSVGVSGISPFYLELLILAMKLDLKDLQQISTCTVNSSRQNDLQLLSLVRLLHSLACRNVLSLKSKNRITTS